MADKELSNPSYNIVELPKVPQEMTPRVALQNLDQACSTISATREVHFLLAKSVELLKDFIEKHSKE